MKSPTKQLGTTGELAVAKDLISRGFEVFTGLGDYSCIDLIAVMDGSCTKVQVKSIARSCGDVVSVTAGSRGKRNVPNGKVLYDPRFVDVVACYVADRDAIAYLPLSTLLQNAGGTKCLRFRPAKSGRVKDIAMFNDFSQFPRA